MKNSDNVLYLKQKNGLYSFYPEVISENNILKKIKFKINKLKELSKVTIKYGQLKPRKYILIFQFPEDL
ncbi:MAG: hypothetical protein HOP07_10145 [Bacteriovoracaceae bacterium]|nr:hypothetical protein [Bacteriovoracaceae bacterium]